MEVDTSQFTIIPKPTLPNISFDEWMDLAQYSEQTKHIYGSFVKFMPNPNLINQDFVNSFVQDHNYLTARAFLKNYVHNYLKLSHIEVPKIRGSKKKKRPIFLTKEEVDFIAEKSKEIDRRISLIIYMMFETASRISEMLNLTAENINLRTPGHYTISGLGKGNEEFLAFISRRTALYLAELVTKNEISNSGKLFPNEGDNKLYPKKTWDIIKNLGEKHLNKKIGNHTFKRSCGNYLLNVRKWPINKVKLYLRHDKYDTMKPYIESGEHADIEGDWKSAFDPTSSPSAQES